MKKLVNNIELQEILKEHFDWYNEDTHAFIETFQEYKAFAYGYLICYYKDSPELFDNAITTLLQEGGLLDKWDNK